MSSIEKYKKYRHAQRKLNQKILETGLTRDLILEGATLLNIVQGDVLMFESEDESSVLMDFVLHDCKVNNKSIVETYREKGGWNKIEKEILDALISSYTSLFRITSVSKKDSIVWLNDLLNEKDGIPLTDILFSKTAFPRALLFTRLVQFADFNMSSGVSFAFHGNLERYLLRQYKVLEEKVESDSESVRRFVAFHELSKMKGIDTQFR